MPTVADIKQNPSKKSKPEDKPEDSKPTELVWHTPEYIYYEKSPDWYWTLGLITLALVGISVYQRNFLFALIVVVGAFAIGLYAVRKPSTIVVSVSSSGIHVGDRLFPYDRIQSFWIFYRLGGAKELSLILTDSLLGRVRIPLGDTDPVSVRAALLEFVREKPEEESLIDAISHLIKF